MKAKLANALLVVSSIFIALLLGEFALRKMLFSDTDAFASLKEPSAYAIYPEDKDEDFYNDDYWKLVHLFRERVMVKEAHPLLGWCGRFDRETLLHSDSRNLNGRRPVLLYGDSFAQCVDSAICFEEILNNDPQFSQDHYLLNYGVGGYGLDQISLLFEKTFGMYDNPFVIFSLLATDMDRSMLTFRDSQKPYYEIEHDSLVLKGVPLHGSTGDFVEDHPPAIRSYLLNRFRNSRLNPFRNTSDTPDHEYMEDIRQLNGLILQRVFRILEESGLDYVILLFNPEDHQLPDWRLEFLTGFCEEENVPYISDRDIRLRDASGKDYDPNLYAIRGDGHPTSHMNLLIAGELREIILGTGLPQGAMEQARERHRLNIEDYRRRILSDADWMDQIREKASERNIPVDSMVTLDAIYMAGKHIR